MTAQFSAAHFADAIMQEDYLAEQAVQQTRNFDLPPALHLGTIALYVAFLALLAVALPTPGLVLPMAIFFIYIAMAFGVPAMWSAMKPDHDDRPSSWSAFRRNGIDCATGHLTAGEAMGQVMILPFLILGWGVAVVAILAFVR